MYTAWYGVNRFRMLTSILLFIATITTDPIPNLEQLTADYFFETIWTERYSDYKSIEFDSKTNSAINGAHVYGCGAWSDNEKKEIEKEKINKEVTVRINLKNISVKKLSNSKRVKLTIGERIKVGDYYVVQMEVCKPESFVDRFFIKLDKDGQIIGKCEFYEII